MNKSEYATMEEFEKTYWWHRGRLHLLESMLDKIFPGNKDLKIFEIGSGTGEVTKYLQNYGYVYSVDVSLDAVNFSKENGLTNVEQADIVEMDISDHENKYDLAVALDVFEHIQKDTVAMKKAFRILKPGGYLITTVPAHKFLWSEHDEALHHKRRYHSVEITKKLEDAGFQISKMSYFVFTAFLPILVFRLWNSIFGRSVYPKTSYVKLPKFLNNFATNILKVESSVFMRARLPIGTTLVVAAVKAM